ncbi:hypothetical protein FA15DRAFT_743694 [Coprinopsis marcescibilis]|uniref:Crinkler effector protein N-terminal domain-containing protein n=1 Tax=Coprinopsis marcescibilis TaxID=230819 RepID=A0A5C3KTG2_COPMA|nr:hypothetical protein FA15DRAFT_743694 [Coprinopsis marcescibilis]
MATIALNCLVFGDGADKIFTIEIAPDKNINILKALIREQNLDCFAYTALSAMQLFRVSLPIGSTLSDSVWGLESREMDKLMPPTTKISALFGDPMEDELHVVVFVPETVAPDVDQVSELPEFTRTSCSNIFLRLGVIIDVSAEYRNTVGTKGHVPSAGAKSSGYCKVQTDQPQTIYDGLKAPNGPSTVPPPITIFHCIFQQFLKLVDDNSTQVTTKELIHMEKFTYMLSTLHTMGQAFNTDFWLHLSGILDKEVTQEENSNCTCTDGCYFIQIGEVQVPTMIYEGKNMLGGCNPSIQVGIIMRHSWIKESRKSIQDKCCCLTFMIAAAAGWLSIMGAVLTNKMIIQRLTDLKWVALSSTQDDQQLHNLMWVFVALQKCMKELEAYY